MGTAPDARDVYVQAFSIREQLNSNLYNCISEMHEIGFSGVEAMVIPLEKQGKLPMA